MTAKKFLMHLKEKKVHQFAQTTSKTFKPLTNGIMFTKIWLDLMLYRA